MGDCGPLQIMIAARVDAERWCGVFDSGIGSFCKSEDAGATDLS